MDDQVKQMMAGYAPGYEAIKDQRHMAPTRAVYEEFFALARSASSASALQRDAERLRLASRMTAQPVYDTYALLREKHDPNELALRDRDGSVMRAASEARSADELACRVELEVQRAKKEIARDTFLRYLVVSFANRLLSYNIGKANARLAPAKFLGPFIMVRDEAAQSYEFMKNGFGLDWETIAGTPRYVKLLLDFQQLFEGTSRASASLGPENLEWMKEALFGEILSGLSAAGILLRESRAVFNPSVDEADAGRVRALTEAAGRKRLSRFAWAGELEPVKRN